MPPKGVLRLCTTGKFFLTNDKRFYSNRNVLHLQERGMFQDIFPATSAPEIQSLLEKSTQCVYAGFDPTANSLHVGNLLVLMNLLHWQRSGHQVIAVLGEATGQIGDPSHRKTERDEINSVVLTQNLESIRKNIETIFSNHEKYIWKKTSVLKPPQIVNNLDWYNNLNVVHFIRSVGKYFRLGTMMGRSSVQSRINSEGGMSFTEFSYQIFQGYDWLYLFNKYKCRFQVGGNDQMGNIVSGHDLVKKVTGKTVYGLTLPLITSEGGKKFGKSVGNAVWLSSEKTTSFMLYQFFMRTTDADVENYLKLFTFLPIGEIDSIMTQHKNAPEGRKAQRILAEQVTKLVHGEEGLEAARLASVVLYENSITALSKLNSEEALGIFDGANVVELPGEAGMTAYSLAMKIKCFKTDHDAQRIMSAGGFYINHSRIVNPDEIITAGIHILPNNLTLVRVGKKNYHIVKWM